MVAEHWQNVVHICFDDYNSPQGAIPTPSLPPGTSEIADSFTTANDVPGGAAEPELSHHPEDDQSQEFDPRAWKVRETGGGGGVAGWGKGVGN